MREAKAASALHTAGNVCDDISCEVCKVLVCEAHDAIRAPLPAPVHLRGKALATHSVATEDGQAAAAAAEGFSTAGELIMDGKAKVAGAAGFATAGEHQQARRTANLPPPGAEVSCALVCCRLLQVRGANCLSLSLCRCCSARSLLTARGKTSPSSQEGIWGLVVSGCRRQTRGSRQSGTRPRTES